MARLLLWERLLLGGHLFLLAFGLAGLLWVLPQPQIVASLPAWAQVAFDWSMAGGGAAYMVLGAAAVLLYTWRQLGAWHALTFLLAASAISLGSELWGTSSGLPFGEYRYLSGLGYKIAGLVPFTIPLSWFYLGLVSYVLGRAALERGNLPRWGQRAGAIAIGASLLTGWDLVLDPAMTQATVPFWVWEQPGALFGMPYQNLLGWWLTGAAFMLAASLLWQRRPTGMPRKPGLPLVVYISNLAFGAVLSLAAGLWVPVVLAAVLAILPAGALYAIAARAPERHSIGSQGGLQSGPETPAQALSE